MTTSFVFIRCSYGLNIDERLAVNAPGARAANIPYGLYHYYVPSVDPIKQSELIASLVGKYGTDMSVAVDLEETRDIPADYADRVRRHLEDLTGRLAALGIKQKPLIYTSAGYWIGTLKSPSWGALYPLWLAAWTTAPKPIVPKTWGDWTFWQYSNSGNGAEYGVSSDRIDLNRFNGNGAALEEFIEDSWYAPDDDAIDMLPYLRGDGRLYEVQHVGGPTETFQTQTGDTYFYQCKNAQWEQLYHDAQWVWRGVDTSPGNGRFYIQYEPGMKRAKWMPRYMSVGQSWTGPGHNVQFFNKADCSKSEPNSGNATNRMTFEAYYAVLTWNGVTVKDVVRLTDGHETWFYARGYGLVAWKSLDGGEMAICQVYAPGERPALVREVLPCQM